MTINELLMGLSVICMMLYQFILMMRVYRHIDQIDELLSLISSACKQVDEEAEEEDSHECFR